MSRRRKSNGWIFKRSTKRGGTWYVGYFSDGRKVREAAGPKKSDATALLAQRMRELDDGKWTHPAQPLTFRELLDLVRADWRARGRKTTLTTSTGHDQSFVKHLRAAFGRVTDARSITAARLARYANDRLDAGAQPSTARNELNVLKRAMRLAHRQGLLPTVPAFPTLTPTNVRAGFFEREQLDTLIAVLPDHVRPIVTLLFWSGWRSGEALSRQWRHVDFDAGLIRLEPGETKNRKGRDFPFAEVPELAAVMEAQREYTRQIERRTGQIVPWVFHRNGCRLKSFRTAWRTACRKTGIDRVPHDLRRTAARNLVRAGVSEKVAMELTGHLTASVFRRYDITDDRDRRDAVKRLAAVASDRQVIPLPDPNRTRKAGGA